MLVVTGKRILIDSESEPAPYTILVKDEKIAEIRPGYRTGVSSNDEVIDACDYMVMPGVVDAHVHINEPGRTQWEGFNSATAAAAAGGVTTLIDMPLNAIPPTTTVPNLKEKTDAARGQVWVDVGFYGGVIPGNHDDLKPLVNAGVKGFKCFMIESGVDEFPHVSEDDMRHALQYLKGTNSFLMFHAEVTDGCCGTAKSEAILDKSAYSTFLESRPKSMENAAIKLVIQLCKEYRVPCHIVHLASAEALPLIKQAKQDGIDLTVETCFHYLFFDAETIPSGATQYKCCPPIREKANRDALWHGLMDGTIDYVVSDHSPCTADLKLLERGDFMKAWGGIASVQFGIPIFWTEGRKRGVKFQDMVRWLSTNTSKRVLLDARKGRLAAGYDADFVVWDPETQFTVKKDDILFKNKVTPYEGKSFYGHVRQTIIRGHLVFDLARGGLQTSQGHQGTLLL